jgi:hypothetical protein
LQQSNGALGHSEDALALNWTTAYALLLWTADGDNRFVKPRRKAVEWLLEHRSKVVPDNERCPSSYDMTICGWPWSHDAIAWLEPTAVAVLALRRCGLSSHPRVRDGIRLIRDRALGSGGWNFGLKANLGVPVRPQPSYTGWALLALSGSNADASVARQACAYLKRVLPRIRSPRSLGCGLVGMLAWNQRPEAGKKWLDEAEPTHPRYRDLPAELAWLLLASTSRSVRYIGPQAVVEAQIPLHDIAGAAR